VIGIEHGDRMAAGSRLRLQLDGDLDVVFSPLPLDDHAGGAGVNFLTARGAGAPPAYQNTTITGGNAGDS
jgi:hypothetical protein